MIRTKLLPSFNGIKSAAAGGSVTTATCELPVGIRYGAIQLKLSDDGTSSNGNATDIEATLAAMVGDIRVKINGKVQRVHTAVELNQINSVNGQEFVATASGTAGQSTYAVYLTIYFYEPWRKQNGDVKAAGWNVVNVRSFTIEVDIKAGLTSFNVEGIMEWEATDEKEIGLISKVLRSNLGAVGTKQDFNTIDRRDFLQALHFFATSDGKYVSNLKVTANGLEMLDLCPTEANQAKLLRWGLNPDTSATPRYDWVTDYSDPTRDWLNLNGLAEFTAHVEYNAAANGTMNVAIVRVGPPE